jgi:phosphoribosylglycinamide formyltransferase-1
MTKKTKIAILISGRGSNMQALVRTCEDPNFPAEVVLVLSNKIDAAGLEFARAKKIKTAVIEHKNFAAEKNPREEFDKKMSAEIEKSGAEIICLAGFMRLLSPWFVQRWFDRLINIHPSLLPEFKGADAVGDAIKAGAKKSGCTVHFVREEMDCGPIILQAEVEVSARDNKEILAAKILKEEHRIYPEALKIICSESRACIQTQHTSLFRKFLLFFA